MPDTYCHSDYYKCHNGLKMSQFNQILKDVQEYYGDKWVIRPNLEEGAEGGIEYIWPDEQPSINSYRHICWKLNRQNHGGKKIGRFTEWPSSTVDIPDDDFIINPSNLKFSFILKSFYNNDPFTRRELDDLNVIFSKYGLNVMRSGKVKKKVLID